MRHWRIGLLVAPPVLVAVLAGALAATPPARAGGWAVAVLDPLPDRIEPGGAYAVGYWVLQHGSHPYEGDLGPTCLVLVDDDGKRITFPGVPLREPAHFAVAVAVPHNGTWALTATQGIFEAHEIGMLTVPGGLAVNPPPPMSTDDHQHAWGLIRPPEVAAQSAPQPYSGQVAGSLPRARTPRRNPLGPGSGPPGSRPRRAPGRSRLSGLPSRRPWRYSRCWPFDGRRSRESRRASTGSEAEGDYRG